MEYKKLSLLLASVSLPINLVVLIVFLLNVANVYVDIPYVALLIIGFLCAIAGRMLNKSSITRVAMCGAIVAVVLPVLVFMWVLLAFTR